MEPNTVRDPWQPDGFIRPTLTVLVTDLRGSTNLFRACGHDDVVQILQQFSELTGLSVFDVRTRTGQESRIAGFGGDGHLVFFAETDRNVPLLGSPRRSLLYPTGPARALIVARWMVRKFAELRDHGTSAISVHARDALKSVTLACAITYGEVLYGAFGEPYVPGYTGMLETVVAAFRLTKLDMPPDGRRDYIVVSESARRMIVDVQGHGAAGLPETTDSPAHASTRARPLHRELDRVRFTERRDQLSGLGEVISHEAAWPTAP